MDSLLWHLENDRPEPTEPTELDPIRERAKVNQEIARQAVAQYRIERRERAFFGAFITLSIVIILAAVAVAVFG